MEDTERSSLKKSEEADIFAFLDTCRVGRNEAFSHTTKDPPGRYYIPEEDYEVFRKLYCNAIADNKRITLTEKPGAYGPLRVDIDLKADLGVGTKRQYTPAIVSKIVGYYQQEIRRIVDPEDFEERFLLCLVLEKKVPRVEDGVVKDGFHLHFPFFICKGWVQDLYLKKVIDSRMVKENIWGKCTFKGDTPIEVDRNLATKQWLMYGSSKSPKHEPYLCTYALDGNLKKISLTEVFSQEMAGRKKNVNYYLPEFLTVKDYRVSVTLTEEFSKKEVEYQPRKRRLMVMKTRRDEDIIADIQMIKEAELMDMLAPERSDNHDTWLDVGWTLFNIGQGCPEALELWIDFSKKSDKFVDGVCEEEWSKMKLQGKTLGSLLYMAKKDSPERYHRWKDSSVVALIERSIADPKPNELDVSKVFVKMFSDRFVCADAKKNLWYEFKDHRWQEMPEAITMIRLLTKEVVDRYYLYKEELAKRQVTKEEERDINEKKSKRCYAVTCALKTCCFIDKVIKMCRIELFNPVFMRKLNENRKLFVCEDGVLDLSTLVFRDGRPDDYMSFSCGLYFRNFSYNDWEVTELIDYLTKVFPNPARRKYFVDIACTCMEGGNLNKTFLAHTGMGDNAKSITFMILERVFGTGDDGYCIKFPRELLIVGKGNSSSSARPELSRVRGKKLAIVQEIAKTELINIGVLKELTGNDSFFSRGLYEKGTEIKPMFTLMMMCNELPRIPGHDEATWNRIRVLDYESKFVKPKDLAKYPVPDDEKEQMEMKRFRADPNFISKIDDMAQVLLWYLFEKYKEYKKSGLVEPDEVTASTEIYRCNNDVYMQFMAEKMEHVEDFNPENITKETPFVGVVEAHEEFNDWFKINHPSYSKEKIGRATFKHEMAKKIGAPMGTKWYGWKLRLEEGMLNGPGVTKSMLLKGEKLAKDSTVKEKTNIKPQAHVKLEAKAEVSKSKTIDKPPTKIIKAM